jgi:glyoxylate reductase
MGRVLVTRRLPDGGLDQLADHEVVGPNPDDSPYSHEELCAHAGECDAIVSLLTDRIDAIWVHLAPRLREWDTAG